MPATTYEANETKAVRVRYARRQGDSRRYSLLTPAVLLAFQEKQRAMADLFIKIGWRDLSSVRLLEVGCGTGANLLDLLRFGFKAEHLQGIELLPASAEQARSVLPASVRITVGDAADPAGALIHTGSLDVVYQSTVFSSLLDDAFQQRLADTMWRYVRPGGGVLWYDFTVNNPRNRGVRGVPVKRIRQLFPEGALRLQRITLAPPIARLVTRLNPKLYSVFNACAWLRTHVLAWIEKSERPTQPTQGLGG
jgi:SAM-dependent methyltransferase